jgi:hypothetical protein
MTPLGSLEQLDCLTLQLRRAIRAADLCCVARRGAGALCGAEEAVLPAARLTVKCGSATIELSGDLTFEQTVAIVQAMNLETDEGHNPAEWRIPNGTVRPSDWHFPERGNFSVTRLSNCSELRAERAMDMHDFSDLPMITDAMPRRGYSEERIRKLLGGNLLRVFRQITEKGTAAGVLNG